jgi:predicted dehydrogenase
MEIPIPWKPRARGATWVIARGTPPKMDKSTGPPPPPDVRTPDVRTVDAGIDLFALEADRFAESILDGAPVLITPADSMGNMRLLDDLRRQVGVIR